MAERKPAEHVVANKKIETSSCPEEFFVLHNLPPPFLLTNMPPSISFTATEAWIGSQKFLHKDGVLYTIRPRDRDADYVATETWTFDHWCGKKATKALQTQFSRVWTTASRCCRCNRPTTQTPACATCRVRSVLKRRWLFNHEELQDNQQIIEEDEEICGEVQDNQQDAEEYKEICRESQDNQQILEESYDNHQIIEEAEEICQDNHQDDRDETETIVLDEEAEEAEEENHVNCTPLDVNHLIDSLNAQHYSLHPTSFTLNSQDLARHLFVPLVNLLEVSPFQCPDPEGVACPFEIAPHILADTRTLYKLLTNANYLFSSNRPAREIAEMLTFHLMIILSGNEYGADIRYISDTINSVRTLVHAWVKSVYASMPPPSAPQEYEENWDMLA